MAVKDVMLWNKEYTQSCKASKVREINIYPCHNQDPKGMEAKVYGWYNKDEYFDFGYFLNTEDARRFIVKLHKQIREGR